MPMFPFLLLLAQTLPAIEPETPLAPPPPPPPVLVFFIPPPVELPVLLTPKRPPDAPPVLPETVRAVIAAAVASGDPQAVAAVIRYAKASNPETVVQIDRINDAYLARLAARQAREAREKRDALLAAGPFDFWKGEAELGASRSTGNTNTLGIYAAGNGTREGIDWRHRLTARVDFQRTDNRTSTERANIAYQPNYKVDDRLYIYGLGQYEHDRFLGYDTRLTAGGGAGYRVVAEDDLKLDLEGGPALRRTSYVDDRMETLVAGRASLVLAWRLSPTINLTQNAAIYVDPGDRNATANTAIDTTLFGSLKARLSYNVQYEGDAPPGRDPVDTLSRATLVYSF